MPFLFLGTVKYLQASPVPVTSLFFPGLKGFCLIFYIQIPLSV